MDELRSEENQLQSKLSGFKQEVDLLSGNLANSQIQISQIKNKLMHMEEYERQLTEGTAELESAITSNDIHRLNFLLSRSISPPLMVSI